MQNKEINLVKMNKDLGNGQASVFLGVAPFSQGGGISKIAQTRLSDAIARAKSGLLLKTVEGAKEANKVLSDANGNLKAGKNSTGEIEMPAMRELKDLGDFAGRLAASPFQAIPADYSEELEKTCRIVSEMLGHMKAANPKNGAELQSAEKPKPGQKIDLFSNGVYFGC